MRIGNYRAYATIPINELSTSYQDVRKIPQKRQLSSKGIAQDLRIYGGLIVDLMI